MRIGIELSEFLPFSWKKRGERALIKSLGHIREVSLSLVSSEPMFQAVSSYYMQGDFKNLNPCIYEYYLRDFSNS